MIRNGFMVNNSRVLFSLINGSAYQMTSKAVVEPGFYDIDGNPVGDGDDEVSTEDEDTGEIEEIAPDVFALDEWQEHQHPRDKDGKFGAGGGGTPSAQGNKTFKSKKEHIGHLLTQGTTPKEIMQAMNWPSVSMQAQAKSLGMKLEKKDGKYFGSKMTDAELADAKQAKLDKSVGAAMAKIESAVKSPEEAPAVGKPPPWAMGSKIAEAAAEAGENPDSVGNILDNDPASHAEWAENLVAEEADQEANLDEFHGWVQKVKAAALKKDKAAIVSLFQGEPGYVEMFKDMQPETASLIDKAMGAKPTKAPQATPEELKKATKSTPLPLLSSDPDATAAVKAFNDKYQGKNNLTPEQLNQKVQDHKDLLKDVKEKEHIAAAVAQVKAEAAWKKKVQEEQAKKDAEEKSLEQKFAKNPELKLHHEAMEALLGGGKQAAQYTALAQARIKAAGLSDKIRPEEAVAIVAYSGSHYAQLNDQIRSGTMSIDQYKFMKSLNAGLDRLPAHTTPTFRKASLTPAQASLYKTGMITEERAFMSTSKNKGTWSGSHTFEVRGKSGRDISKLSSHASEAEVLFKSGTRFHVKDVKGTHIILEEV